MSLAVRCLLLTLGLSLLACASPARRQEAPLPAAPAPEEPESSPEPHAAAEPPPHLVARAALPQLLPALRAVFGHPSESLQRRLCRAYHLIANATEGRAWSAIEAALATAGVTLEERRAPPHHLFGGALLDVAWRDPSGQPYALDVVFWLRMHTPAPVVEAVEVFLETKPGDRTGSLCTKDYAEGSLIRRVLEAPATRQAAARFPVLRSLRLQHLLELDRWREADPYVFYVDVDFWDRTEEPRAGEPIAARARTRLDPWMNWTTGEHDLQGFLPEDTLWEVEIESRGVWGEE